MRIGRRIGNQQGRRGSASDAAGRFAQHADQAPRPHGDHPFDTAFPGQRHGRLDIPRGNANGRIGTVVDPVRNRVEQSVGQPRPHRLPHEAAPIGAGPNLDRNSACLQRVRQRRRVPVRRIDEQRARRQCLQSFRRLAQVDASECRDEIIGICVPEHMQRLLLPNRIPHGRRRVIEPALRDEKARAGSRGRAPLAPARRSA